MLNLSFIQNIISNIALCIEVFGVLTILIGGIFATVQFLKCFKKDRNCAYKKFRSELGHAILLGLEFLVAGDIIGTVAIKPSYESLGILAIIVLIRTFLSFSLELEISGRWPWQTSNVSAGKTGKTEETSDL